ncbi:hypothetical protein A6A40_10670 [Azospirillum humicireducens]|uniref:Uncharacterized protein n=1 Tax=Azospirillum humicireducens TaxID=1226968 RepID=A0A168Y8X6_9PROT|nr:hypothetical protein [Azospirillum humicireducens]ANC92327.1 hypothetical protein A6A40_10670 [Azospirillum humicireducens]
MFPDHGHRRISVASPDDTATARRIAAERADGVLAAEEAARLDSLVAALSGYVLGRPDGTLLIARMRSGAGVECLAYDRDPATAEELPTDAAQGLGADLEAVRRLADRFHIHATPGIGSALLVRVLRPGADDSPHADAMAEVGAVMVGRQDGETALREPFLDHWFVRCSAARGPDGPCGIALMIDGETEPDDQAADQAAGGGGEDARSGPFTRMTPEVIAQVETVVAATVPDLPAPVVVNAIRRDLRVRPELGLSHDPVLKQIGRSALAILRFDGKAVDYTALGTLAGAVVRPQEILALGARWAMVGFNPLAPASVHLLWGPGDHVVLYTSGCARLPALFIHRNLHKVDPTLTALVLLRDGAVRDDDHTILVLRNRADRVPASAG